MTQKTSQEKLGDAIFSLRTEATIGIVTNSIALISKNQESLILTTAFNALFFLPLTIHFFKKAKEANKEMPNDKFTNPR